MGGLSDTGQRGHRYHSAMASRRESSGRLRNERLELLFAASAEVLQAVRDVGGGKLIASGKDGAGNIIGLIQAA